MESVRSSILLNCLPALCIPEPHPGSANQGASCVQDSHSGLLATGLWHSGFHGTHGNVRDLVLLAHPLAVCCLSPGHFPKSVEGGAASHPDLGAKGRIF